MSQRPVNRPNSYPPPRMRRPPAPPPPPSRPSGAILAGLGAIVVLLVLLVGIVLLRPATPSGAGTQAVAVATATSAPAGPASAVTPGAMQAGDSTPAATPYGTPIAGLTVVTGLDRNHTKSPVTYPQIPPLGGPHSDQWQNCGVYDQPIANEAGVHSLEHGAIWITYRPDLPVADVNTLRGLTHQTNYRLLSPYPGLPHPIVLSAWGYQLPLENVNDPRLNAFLADFQQNPNGPEPGASCSGSNGSPLP